MIARVAAAIFLLVLGTNQVAAGDVVVRRVPHGGFKASASVDRDGQVHLIYFTGEPTGGDAWYVRSKDGGATFSEPLRVNRQPESVLGASSARGPHLALGKDGRIHALWMGSVKAQPRGPLNPALPADNPFNGIPLFYSYLDPATGTFIEPRNPMTRTVALDGDSALVTDQDGGVYIIWHAQLPGGKDEGDRSVWLAHSTDNGLHFSEERNVMPRETGACPCCALTACLSKNGSIAIVYRAAEQTVHRGMSLLHSEDRGKTFKLSSLDDWKLSMCPMSTASLIDTKNGFIGAWENDGRLGFSRLPGSSPQQLSGDTPRKHPTLAINNQGETLLAWAEGVSFGKGGTVGWQRFDASGKMLGSPGHAEALPGHGNIAAVALPDGNFAVIY